MTDPVLAEAEAVPVGHRGGPPLYGRMMKAIASGHSFGNNVRMLKLPLIFAESGLYAQAIAQFFWLTETLEARLEEHASHPMVVKVRSLGLVVTPGYAADLNELLGNEWREAATKTTATLKYIRVLEEAEPVSLCAAAFILYGALVVGGGKLTQQKVRKVLPECEHRLYDVAEDMKAARRDFKAVFTQIGKEWPEHFSTLESEAARFMALNNTVMLSIRCWGRVATAWTLAVTASIAAAIAAVRLARRLS